MVLRLIVLALIVAAVLLLLRSWQRRPAAPRPRPEEAIANMVTCAQCGVHLPESEALRAEGHTYCCPEHRARGPRRP